MGASILSGVTAVANVTGLFGPPSGTNAPVYAKAGQITGDFMSAIGIVAALNATLGVGVGGTLAGISAVGGPIGIAVGAALLIVSHIFHGADPLDVPASQVEQAFDAAGRNLVDIEQSAYLTQAETLDGLRMILKAGTLYYNQILETNPAAKKDPKPFTDGIKTLTTCLNAYIIEAQKWMTGGEAARPWDETAAQKIYIAPNTHGWYPQSLESALTLTNGYTKTVLDARAAGTAPAAATVAPASAVTGPAASPAPAAAAASAASAAGQTTASKAKVGFALGGLLVLAKLLA
jgi:hypothetical protein